MTATASAQSELTIDPRSTALVLIDLQHGVVDRELAPHTGPQVVGNAARLGQRWNELGMPVFPVRVAYSADEADRLRPPVDAPTPGGAPPAHWSDLVPEIAALQAAAVITKRQWGAFHGTELDLQLRRRGVRAVVLCGIATNFGVESTAREAWQHAYELIIPEDACTSMEAAMHRFSFERILPRLSRIRSTAAVLAALRER